MTKSCQKRELLLTILSAIYILFLQGFSLSFALSIAVVPLCVFYTNLLGIKITQLSVLIQTFGIIAIAAGIIAVQTLWKKS